MTTECEATLLGREAVDGAVHAASLASLVRGLAGAAGRARTNRQGPQGRGYFLRCSELGVELVARRSGLHRSGRQDDEGFESDDDRRSTRSDDSNSVSSSCYLVEDHVLKTAAAPGPVTTSSTSSDSANSSGGSDTDEVDAGVGVNIGGPKSLDAVAPTSIATSAVVPIRENFSFQDVAFFHVDAAFPRVVVLVVRRPPAPRRLRLGREPPPAGGGGLEAVVLECRSEDSLRALCSSYQELSRRVRLDGQYRAPHRRKDLPTHSGDESRSKDSNNIKVVNPLPSNVLPKFIFSKVDEIPSERINSGPCSISSVRDSEVGSLVSRFNLVHRTDGDGVTHIEVSRGSGSQDDASATNSVNESDQMDMCGPSSIISISTPDSGNMLMMNSASKDRSRISKEIEGVIRTDVETGISRREPGFRQRQQPDVLEAKLWTKALAPDDSIEEPCSGPASLPPQRPERKRFIRKNKAPAPPTPPADGVSTLKKPQDSTLNRTQTASGDAKSRSSTEQRVVRGQFIRVSVDQQKQQPANWVNHFPAGWTGPAPARSGTPHPCVSSSTWRRDMPLYQDAGVDLDHRQRYQRRSRSSDSGRGHVRTKSPPTTRRPMAYRYIDTPAPTVTTRPHTPTTNSLSNRFFGLSQKLREIKGSVVSAGYSGTGRRNSWGDTPSRFYTTLDLPPGKSASCPGNNLKSVIKKTHQRDSEPKKVTFSAYATVQVVD